MYTIHQSSKKRRQSRSKNQNLGTTELPRVCVFRSNKNMYVQAIDDKKGNVIASFSTLSDKSKDNKTQKSSIVGEGIASKLTSMKILNIVFDRNGYKYHGRVKAVADAMRSKGINF